MYIYYNPNPFKRATSDCVTRAIAKFFDLDWDTAFLKLSLMAYAKKDNLEKNHVWGDLLTLNGYRRHFVPNMCPNCYTVKDFCEQHPKGRYLLKLDDFIAGHVVTVIDGDYYDSWDSGEEIVDYYYD